MLTRSGVARVMEMDVSCLRRAAAIEDWISVMEDVGTLLTAITVESRRVERHLGIRPAGVDGRHSFRMTLSLSGWLGY